MPFPAISPTDDSALNQPPPSPALADGQNPGYPAPNPTISQALGPGGGGGMVNSQSMPMDVLKGMTEAATKIAQDLDAFAQMTPDLAADWALVRQALATVMAKVLMAGGGPVSSTNPGPAFPGGGLDRGGTALASGGM